ncbi:PrgI family protein [Psychrobacillus sp. MER TA 171]|uniref:PrgI family protein n=1 Tax=Psychrobacillus sp. MER TA 171 TaxID=2939577 RepID=UPI00203F383F|nr:PrgI family protein [Psychrobacillus sp. MER TA 171]MCM3358056.1 PrgI family protein [Psychrobacillus sp. MER TA 171]
MRVEKVPIDMSSEQKEILGLVSKRQVLYLVGGILVLYSYVPKLFMFVLPLGIVLALLVTILAALPVLTIVGFLGFYEVKEYNMNRDYYYYIKLTRKTQYGSWRKGR